MFVTKPGEAAVATEPRVDHPIFQNITLFGHHPGFPRLQSIVALGAFGLGRAVRDPSAMKFDEIRIKSDFLVYFDDAFDAFQR